jgi:hypothetical protein
MSTASVYPKRTSARRPFREIRERGTLGERTFHRLKVTYGPLESGEARPLATKLRSRVAGFSPFRRLYWWGRRAIVRERSSGVRAFA